MVKLVSLYIILVAEQTDDIEVKTCCSVTLKPTPPSKKCQTPGKNYKLFSGNASFSNLVLLIKVLSLCMILETKQYHQHHG